MPITTDYFTYPTSAEMRLVSQDLLPRLMTDRPIFDILPITTAKEFKLIWEQLDNFQGLQQWRGLNGAPPKVAQTGLKQFTVSPGVYGEYMLLDEERLTTSRDYGRFGTPMDLTDLVSENLVKLLQRRLDLIEHIGWNILQGSYSIAGPNGAIMVSDSYTPQTYTAATPWSTTASATPFKDFMAVRLLHRGHSVDFGTGAKAYMNLGTATNLLNNSNTSDLWGRRVETGGAGVTINSIQQLNPILSANGAPEIVVYDEGYLSDGSDGNAAGSYQLYIPNNTVIVVGKRPGGQRLGEYRMVKNINNPDAAPGAYTQVLVPTDHLPKSIQVHDGHNGGPVIIYPSALVIMSV